MWEEEKEEKKLERVELFEVSQSCREQLSSSVRAVGAVYPVSDEECGVWQWQKTRRVDAHDQEFMLNTRGLFNRTMNN